MTREQLQKLGPEVLWLWSNWEQIMIKDVILCTLHYKRHLIELDKSSGSP